MYSLRTFGALSLARDGSVVEPLETQRKTLAILTVLATDGTVTRDRLMALLWPDSDIERARGSLKQAIHSLRQQLDAPNLVLGKNDLSLNPSLIASDVGRFQEALKTGESLEAVALYQGPFLDGVHLNSSAELEQWVETRRATLTRSYRDALERLARGAESREDSAEAIRWWTQRTTDDRLDAKAALHLMEALETGGQRTAALQHLRSHEELLRRELGVGPDPAIIALGNRLLNSPTSALTARPQVKPHGARTPASAEPDTPVLPPPVRRSSASRLGLITLAVTTIAGFAIAAYRRTDSDVPADLNLMAIAPFDVLDPSLELWGEGLMDVLTEDLDGAGPLRTVAQSVALRRWSGRANRGSADEFGGVTGAGLIVYGKVARRGQDSVSIRVTLLDRTPNAGRSELVEVTGPEGRMGELADSLGVKILRTLGRSRAIGSQRHVSIGSRSLPALKEFLKGEQFYRRGLFDSALARYDRAIAEDSTFALALRRMAWALGLGAPTSWKYASRAEYLHRAVTLNHGLSPRDSVLLRVDSLIWIGTRSRNAEEIVANTYAIFRSLEGAVRRYPDDPGIWYELGEQRMHGSSPLGGFPGPALDAFDRAIALDSGFAPAYQHTVRLALQLGQVERAREYARAYVALNPSGENALALRLTRLVLDSGGVHAPAVWQQIKNAHGGTLMWAGFDHFRWMVDTAETAVVLLRELVTGNHDLSGSDTSLSHHLAVALVFRGHLRAAADVNRPLLSEEGIGFYRFSLDRFLDLALWNILPDSIVRRTYQRGLMPGTDWSVGSTFSNPRFLRALPYWYARGDSTSISRFSQRAGEVARTKQSGVAPLRGRYFETASLGYLALMRGDSAGAERYFGSISDTLCSVGTCFNEKLVLAQIIAARGDDRRAAEILDQWELAGDNTTFAVLASLERGEIAERLGDRATAVARYQFVIDAWRRADPELQPFVEQARAGLRRHRR